MMHAGDRQQRRDRRVLAVDAAVGQDDVLVPGRDRGARLPAQAIRRRSSPAPFLRVYRIGSVTDLNGPRPCLELAQLVQLVVLRIGDFSLICRADCGAGSSRLNSPPMVVAIDMMISSRMQSTGGLVTWAKSCLK